MNEQTETKNQAVILAPDAGKRIEYGANNSATFKAASDLTDDRLGVYELSLAPQTLGASPHFHRRMEEMFYILDGTLEMLVGEETLSAPAGTFVFVPRLTVHGFKNRTDETVKFLLLFTPALKREGYFEAMAELAAAGQSINTAEHLELMRRYDQEAVALDW